MTPLTKVLIKNNVAENRKGFNRREYGVANAACRALGLVGCPSERDLSNMVSSNMIVNFPITFFDIQNVKNIFGPDVPSMKGKSVQRRQEAVVSDYVEITQ